MHDELIVQRLSAQLLCGRLGRPEHPASPARAGVRHAGRLSALQPIEREHVVELGIVAVDLRFGFDLNRVGA